MDCTAMGISKKQKINFGNTEDVIKVLNNRRTTIEVVMTSLQNMIEDFQNVKENFYVEEFEEIFRKRKREITEEDLQQYTSEIETKVQKDTIAFVSNYVTKMNDVILDAINSKELKKRPGHAFLILLQSMESAFSSAA